MTTDDQITSTTEPDRVQKAIEAGVPRIYANGFVNGLGTGDIVIVLERNNEPEAILNLSYTVAKTLAVKLGSMVQSMEEISGHEIMTTDYIGAKVSAQEAKNET